MADAQDQVMCFPVAHGMVSIRVPQELTPNCTHKIRCALDVLEMDLVDDTRMREDLPIPARVDSWRPSP